MLGHTNQPLSTKAALATTNIKMQHDLPQLPLHKKKITQNHPSRGPWILASSWPHHSVPAKVLPCGPWRFVRIDGRNQLKGKNEKEVGAHVHVLQPGWTPVDSWPRVKLKTSRSKRSKQCKIPIKFISYQFVILVYSFVRAINVKTFHMSFISSSFLSVFLCPICWEINSLQLQTTL